MKRNRHALIAKLRREWHDFKALPAGRRFQAVHEQQASAPTWVKVAIVAGSVVAFGIGVVLVFIPGPAFVFFGASCAMVATESSWVARGLDRGEVFARKMIARTRERVHRIRRGY